MSDRGFRYIRNRIAFLLTMLVVALGVGLWLMPRGEPATRTVAGNVMEVSRGQGESLRGTGTATLVTARVRLEDGREVLVLVSGTAVRPGDAVLLAETIHPEGEPRYRLRAPGE